jgi:hypothetical protein
MVRNFGFVPLNDLARFTFPILLLTGSRRTTPAGAKTLCALSGQYKTQEVIAALDNQQHNFNDNLQQVIAALDNQQHNFNDKMQPVIAALDNQQRMLYDKLSELVADLSNHSRIVDSELRAITESVDNQTRFHAQKLSENIDSSHARLSWQEAKPE